MLNCIHIRFGAPMLIGCLQDVWNSVEVLTTQYQGAWGDWWPTVDVSTAKNKILYNFQQFRKNQKPQNYQNFRNFRNFEHNKNYLKFLGFFWHFWRLTHQYQVIRGAGHRPGPLIVSTKHPHTMPDVLEASNEHRSAKSDVYAIKHFLHKFTQIYTNLHKFTRIYTKLTFFCIISS